MFGSLRQSVNASFADRFLERDDAVYFRPLMSRTAYQLSTNEAATSIDDFAELTARVDKVRSRMMRAIIPAVIVWAFICIFLRRNISRELFGDVFYIATATGVMLALPVLAYGQFWLAVVRYVRDLGERLSGRPSIDAPVLQSYETRNPFQFALRWTALSGLCAFLLIGVIFPETNPELASDLKPWIAFDVGQLLSGLGILYGLSMLWDWIAARRATKA